MTNPTIITITLNGKCLTAPAGQWTPSTWQTPNASDVNQQWAYYSQYGFLVPVGPQWASINNGWVALDNGLNDLWVGPAWNANTSGQAWMFDPSGDTPGTGTITGAGGLEMGVASDGVSLALVSPPMLNWAAPSPPPPPPPPPQTGLLLGVSGDTAADFSTKFLGGRKVDLLPIYGGYANGINDFGGAGSNSVSYALSQVESGYQLMFSLPLCPTDPNYSLADAAAGQLNQYYQNIAAIIAQYGANGSGKAPLARLGVEMNLAQWPWTGANGQAANYIAAFNLYAGILKAAVPGITIIWCTSRGLQQVDPETCYPGSTNVDWHGIDVYENSTWDTNTDGAARFASIRADTGRSLDWAHQFALSNGKPLCIPEWGSNINGTPYYQEMHDWMLANGGSNNGAIANLVWIENPFDFTSQPANGPLYEAAFNNWP